jgi:hypothetical protein
MKSIAWLVTLAVANGCASPSHQADSKAGNSSVASADTSGRVDPVSLIMAGYQAKRITADSAAQALFAEATRTHQPLTVQMDSALREAVARAIRVHDGSPPTSHR